MKRYLPLPVIAVAGAAVGAGAVTA